MVKRSQPIAQVGNSGDTSEPHLHVQVQNGPKFGPSAQRGCRPIRCWCAMSCSFAAGSSPRPFRQILAATIASAGSAADRRHGGRSALEVGGILAMLKVAPPGCQQRSLEGSRPFLVVLSALRVHLRVEAGHEQNSTAE
jgi:murein DD-endopeptidase MepM/ murein hydrolase activator NlpD